jgi:hypothetical protein
MRHITSIFLIISILACNKPTQRNNEITKVELARSGAWSDYGAAISVDSTLSYKYFDGNIKHGKGYFTGRVGRKFWDTLNQKFERIKFKTVDTNDNSNVVDVNYFEVIVYWENKKKRIIRASSRENDSVINVILWLNNSYKKVKLHLSSDPIKFETTYQNPPPKPIIDRIKFPPPIKRKS